MKLQKQQTVFLPLSDWDIFPWTKEMYQRHAVELQKILLEYREIKNLNDNAIMARYVWLEKKGAVILYKKEDGGFDVNIVIEKYPHFSNMFSVFDDWLSRKERIELTNEQARAKIEGIRAGMKTVDFSIPKSILDGAERDVSNDEMTQDALNNF